MVACRGTLGSAVWAGPTTSEHRLWPSETTCPRASLSHKHSNPLCGVYAPLSGQHRGLVALLQGSAKPGFRPAARPATAAVETETTDQSPASSSKEAPERLHALHPLRVPPPHVTLRRIQQWHYAHGAGRAYRRTHPELHSAFLSDNYAPVRGELHQEDLKVQGVLPAALEGVFVRNGPNPFYAPDDSKYHWFDGDGMLHALRIRGGAASYCNRYVETHRLQTERDAGHPIFVNLGEMRGINGLMRVLLTNNLLRTLGLIDGNDSYMTANTALLFHGGRLLALQEADFPYTVRMLEDGGLETVGRETFDGKLTHPFTAHPKVDPVTGELLFYGTRADQRPFCFFSKASSAGDITSTVPINLPAPCMMHDFAITASYALFVDSNLVIDPSLMMSHGTLPMTFDASRPARIGLLPRNAIDDSEMQWFEVPPTMVFHTANAWEEGPIVKLYACCMNVAMLRKLLDPQLVVRESQPHLPGHDTSGYASNLVPGPPWRTRQIDLDPLNAFPYLHPRTSQVELDPLHVYSEGSPIQIKWKGLRARSNGDQQTSHPSPPLQQPGLDTGIAAAAIATTATAHIADPAANPLQPSVSPLGSINLRRAHHPSTPPPASSIPLPTAAALAAEAPASMMYEFTLDTYTGRCTQRRVSQLLCDFPTVPASRVGRKCRYAYAAALEAPLSAAVVKIDLQAAFEEDAVVGRIEYGPGRSGGEALFRPRHDDPDLCDGEDDGFLMTYIYDSTSGTSEFVVYDAKTMDPAPVASVALPQRVPYGFHSTFITEQQLRCQLH